MKEKETEEFLQSDQRLLITQYKSAVRKFGTKHRESRGALARLKLGSDAIINFYGGNEREVRTYLRKRRIRLGREVDAEKAFVNEAESDTEVVAYALMIILQYKMLCKVLGMKEGK